MDWMGIDRMIDQAIYTLLNLAAMLLWRLDAAVIGISLYGYATEDWLIRSGGGVWGLLDWLIGGSGIFGLTTWQLVFGLALMLYGLSLLARPFIGASPVQPGKLFIFALISYVIIGQGSELFPAFESWRAEAGSAAYQGVADSSVELDVDTPASPSDPLGAPADLDGESPLRGWEAVATSYFLVSSQDDLHQSFPPAEFRLAYCLYRPDLPINDQVEENSAGCSPQKAWDEWDLVEVDLLRDIFGIEVELDFDFFDLFDDDILEPDAEDDSGLTFTTTTVPVIQQHPENRELAIRQAQAGVARLAMGSLVALFPLVEANISLMLALAASFIYLTLPISLLFGFFLPTEPMTHRLLMQYVNVVIRTLVLHGLVALFMLLLMGTALSGSLMAYLGLVGVGLVGGLFLSRVAAGTMTETLKIALSSVTRVWLGTSTGLLGQSAAAGAQVASGVAKLGATAALMGVAGASMIDLAEAELGTVRSGLRDLDQAAPGPMRGMRDQANRLPAPIAGLTQFTLSPGEGEFATDGRAAAGSNDQPSPLDPLVSAGTAAAMLPSRSNGPEPSSELDTWLAQASVGQGQPPATQTETGRALLGEELAWKVERALARRSQAETAAVLTAAKNVAARLGQETLVQRGRLTPAALEAVMQELESQTQAAFSDRTGRWDLAALTAAALQEQQTVSPEAFRQAVASADPSSQALPAQQVSRTLGLDPVAVGAHWAALNRFARQSGQAGLSTAEREQLLAQAQAGQITDELRQTLETKVQAQRVDGTRPPLQVQDLVDTAVALPQSLTGPRQIWIAQAAKVEPAKPDPVVVKEESE